MVIHDMRNPTNSIKVGLDQTLQTLRDLESIFTKSSSFKQIHTQIFDVYSNWHLNNTSSGEFIDSNLGIVNLRTFIDILG